MIDGLKSDAPSEEMGRADLLELTADIVTAYVANNSVEASAFPALIETVFQTVEGLAQKQTDVRTTDTPAVPIEQSVTEDAIICLEDGMPFKSLKRHLRAKYDLSPEGYRAKWGLPADYPMVAPNYAKARSKLARKSGLGRAKRSDYTS
ncbi:MAG: MucR family transcriptional regulator [Maricaulaceae bacterium]